MNRGLPLLAAAALLAGLPGCSVSEPEPNIVWVSIDTLRADHQSCYGYSRQTSPNIDAVAREGVLFEDTWSTTCWTLPAHLSMLTGLPVSAHCGCGENLTESALHPAHFLRGKFLAEDLAAAGWETAGFYSFRYLEPGFGFGRGFETWEFVPRTYRSIPELFAKFTALRDSNDVVGMRALAAQYPEEFDVRKVWAGETVQKGLGWIDAKRAQSKSPFLLFLHIFDVHDPYLPPPPHERQFDPDYSGNFDGTNISAAKSEMTADISPRDLEHLIALYDGEIAAVDEQIGRLVEGLRERGLAGNTIVVITADHGEEFYEHGNKLHRNSLHRETVQVPLILRWPDHLPANRRISGVASTLDLVPTLRAACGLPADPKLPGLDLLKCVQQGKLPDEREVFSELTIHGSETNSWSVSLVDSTRHTLVVDAGTPRAKASRYDRKLDPREEQPPFEIAWDSPEGLQLCAKLDAIRAQLRALRTALGPTAVETRPIGAAAEDRIRELGYSGTPLVPAFNPAHDLPLCMDGCIWAN